MKLDSVHQLDRYVHTLTIDVADLARAELMPADHAVLRDCEGPDRTIADKLVALELLARRIEEGARRVG